MFRLDNNLDLIQMYKNIEQFIYSLEKDFY